MKKKYLFGLILFTLFLTACGSKNTLKCTMEDKSEMGDVKAVMTLKFDKDDKFESVDSNMVINFTSKEVFDLMKLDTEEGLKELCNFYSEETKCTAKRDGQKVTIKVVDDNKDKNFVDQTKDEIIELLKDEENMKCN